MWQPGGLKRSVAFRPIFTNSLALFTYLHNNNKYINLKLNQDIE